MDQYTLGKDVQQILERLNRLETAISGQAIGKRPCRCEAATQPLTGADDRAIEEPGVLVWEGERPCFLEDGRVEVLASKSFTWPAGRLCHDYCNWRRQETVTIWSNGRYEDITEIKCEHGYLYGCVFKVTMRYKDSSAAEITNTEWRRGLGGTESESIRQVGYNQAIQLSYGRITTMTRSRHAEC